eukprot:gene18457-1514_t
MEIMARGLMDWGGDVGRRDTVHTRMWEGAGANGAFSSYEDAWYALDWGW